MGRLNEKGITLTELLIVLSIIVISAAIAAPTFFSYRQTIKLNSAARELISDLRFARQQSITLNKDYRIIFTDTKNYKIEEETTDDWATTKTIKSVDLNAQYSGKVSRTSSFTTVYFKSNGGLDPVKHPAVTGDASAFVMVLNHAVINKSKTIKINRFGRIWVEQS